MGILSVVGAVASAFGSARAGRSVQHGGEAIAASIDRGTMRLADAALKVGDLVTMQVADSTIRALQTVENVNAQWLNEVDSVVAVAVESFNGNVEKALSSLRNLSTDWQTFLRLLHEETHASLHRALKMGGGLLVLNTLLLCFVPPFISSELQGTTRVLTSSLAHLQRFLYSCLYEPVKPAEVVTQLFYVSIFPILSWLPLTSAAHLVYRTRLNELRTDALQRQWDAQQRAPPPPLEVPPPPPEVPVGTVLAYVDRLETAAAPALPEQYMRCDGQPVADAESLFNGKTLPDLNGRRLFLRGGATSGDYELDALQGHGHFFKSRGDSAQSPGNHGTDSGGHGGTRDWSSNAHVLKPIPLEAFGEPRVADETRPKNMSVIWIMRIK